MSSKTLYSISIIFAVIVATGMLVSSYFATQKNEEWIDFSVLGPDKKAEGYPSLMVVGKNNTCHLWVTIENHKKISVTCKVMLKIADTPISNIPLPCDAYAVYYAELKPGERWEQPVTVTITKPGDYYIVFELWTYDSTLDDFVFSNNFLALPVDVTAG